MRFSHLVVALGVLSPWNAGRAQASVNAWSRGDQEAAIRITLTQDVVGRLERVLGALRDLSARDTSYCQWVAKLPEATSIAAEADALGAHPGVRRALATARMAPREFVEVGFALLMAGIAYQAGDSSGGGPTLTPPAANVAFYKAYQARIDRVLALDPC